MAQPTIRWYINCCSSQPMHIRRRIASAATATKAGSNKKFVRFSQNASAMGNLSRMHQSDLEAADSSHCLDPKLRLELAQTMQAGIQMLYTIKTLLFFALAKSRLYIKDVTNIILYMG